MQDLFTENYKALVRKSKDLINEEINCVHELEESVLLRRQYSQIYCIYRGNAIPTKFHLFLKKKIPR